MGNCFRSHSETRNENGENGPYHLVYTTTTNETENGRNAPVATDDNPRYHSERIPRVMVAQRGLQNKFTVKRLVEARWEKVEERVIRIVQLNEDMNAMEYVWRPPLTEGGASKLLVQCQSSSRWQKTYEFLELTSCKIQHHIKLYLDIKTIGYAGFLVRGLVPISKYAMGTAGIGVYQIGTLQLIAANGSLTFEDRRRSFSSAKDPDNLGPALIVRRSIMDIEDICLPQEKTWDMSHCVLIQRREASSTS